MAALGVQGFEAPEWMREELEGGEDPECFGVLEQNWDAVQLFFACGTQWQRDGRGVPIGLYYPGVDVVLRRRRLEDPDDAFDRLQIMEASAAREFARIAARSS